MSGTTKQQLGCFSAFGILGLIGAGWMGIAFSVGQYYKGDTQAGLFFIALAVIALIAIILAYFRRLFTGSLLLISVSVLIYFSPTLFPDSSLQKDQLVGILQIAVMAFLALPMLVSGLAFLYFWWKKRNMKGHWFAK